MDWPFPPAQYIDTDDDLAALIEALSNEPLLCFDTESNSLYVYHERVCLIQISTRERDYIVDPLTIEDMQPLGLLLADESIETVFHAAEYDLMCLKRDYDFEVRNLFDTMIAARILGYHSIGLNNLLREFLGVELDKRHQRDNWGQRPLEPDSLLYAQMDTHYLARLRDILYDMLQSGGYLEEAHETFNELGDLVPAHDGRNFDPEGYWKLGIPNRLRNSSMGILSELYRMRDKLAREQNRPPFKILSNRALVEIARNKPKSLRDLRRIKGVSPAQTRRYGSKILSAVRRGKSVNLPPRPVNHPPPSEISDRYVALHTWRKERAVERGVESDVIVSKQTLWSLAHLAPTSLDQMQGIQGLGPWRLQTYGEEILQVIEIHDSQNGHA